jgi:hypothetical protein
MRATLPAKLSFVAASARRWKPALPGKLHPLAAAALLASTVAGIAFSFMPFVNGSAAAALAVRPAAHTANHVRLSAHRSPKHATTPAAKPATTATQPPASSQPPAAASVAATTPQPLTAGMSSFEQCVAWRESGDTPTDPDGLFGILPSVWAQLGYSGTAGQASVAQQEAAFNQLYAQYGAQPWAPSDGC